MPHPRALLFDIGGVCVISPMSAIADYEVSHSLPPNWINYCISRSGSSGAWHQIETGAVEMNAAFFTHFARDLSNAEIWPDYVTQARERAAAAAAAAKGKTPPPRNAPAWADASKPIPPCPAMSTQETEYLFWEMMRVSRTPDPYMEPALRKLKESGKYLIAALSNTSIFPEGHEYNGPSEQGDVKAVFDVFVSSAHEGLRKPHPEIYELVMRRMNEFLKSKGEAGAAGLSVPSSSGSSEITPKDVVFLDDIGANLRVPKDMGMRTIKVNLGRTKDAVRELERITGMKLLDERASL